MAAARTRKPDAGSAPSSSRSGGAGPVAAIAASAMIAIGCLVLSPFNPTYLLPPVPVRSAPYQAAALASLPVELPAITAAGVVSPQPATSIAILPIPVTYDPPPVAARPASASPTPPKAGRLQTPAGRPQAGPPPRKRAPIVAEALPTGPIIPPHKPARAGGTPPPPLTSLPLDTETPFGAADTGILAPGLAAGTAM